MSLAPTAPPSAPVEPDKAERRRVFSEGFARAARIVALLVERVDIAIAGLNVRLRVDGLAGLA